MSFFSSAPISSSLLHWRNDHRSIKKVVAKTKGGRKLQSSLYEKFGVSQEGDNNYTCLDLVLVLVLELVSFCRLNRALGL